MRIRSACAACLVTQQELAVSVGMTTFFPGTVHDCKNPFIPASTLQTIESICASLNSVGNPSGSRSGHIHHHDVRVADHHIFTLTTHTQEVCGLQWSPDGRYLASGGNDNLVCVWPRVHEGSAGNDTQFVNCWSEHQGAVKVSHSAVLRLCSKAGQLKK